MRWMKVLLFSILLPGIADVLIPWLILARLGKLTFASIGIMQIIGSLLALAGLTLIVWVCQAFFRRGKGKPAPFDPPHQFVSKGLFSWLRNPLYLGAALLVPLGEACFFVTFWLVFYSALLFLISHLYVVYVEEPTLIRRFGRPYKKYLRIVPRWLPRIPRD
jgi:protein-S-isoprenylcysteine O-methyltransferase Ste14